MVEKIIALEFGMGVDIRGSDYTKAAIRAVEDALRRNAFTGAIALGHDPNEMIVDLHVGVQKPEQVDQAKIAATAPYGKIRVHVKKGGIDSPSGATGGTTIAANVAAVVSLDMPEETT